MKKFLLLGVLTTGQAWSQSCDIRSGGYLEFNVGYVGGKGKNGTPNVLGSQSYWWENIADEGPEPDGEETIQTVSIYGLNLNQIPSTYSQTGATFGLNMGYDFKLTNSIIFGLVAGGNLATLQGSMSVPIYNYGEGTVVYPESDGNTSDYTLESPDATLGAARGSTKVRVQSRGYWNVSGRLGLASGRFMPYIKAGFTMLHNSVSIKKSGDPMEPKLKPRAQWNPGVLLAGGVEFHVSNSFIMGIEGGYSIYSPKKLTLAFPYQTIGATYKNSMQFFHVVATFKYKFPAACTPSGRFTNPYGY